MRKENPDLHLGKEMFEKADLVITITNPVKHEARVIPTEEVMANRCSKYEFIDFDKESELIRLAESLVDRHTNSSVDSPYRKILERYVLIGLKANLENLGNNK